MNDTKHKRAYESADDQIKRLNRVIDWFASKYLIKIDEPEEPLFLKYKKLCVMADANYATLSHASHPEKIDISYAGASYDGGRGQTAELLIKPKMWLRNRGKLDDHERIGGGSREDYVMKKGEFGDA